ncbi:MAG: hypothetical protein WC541_06830, partial [Dehalococcoidia bacterium]
VTRALYTLPPLTNPNICVATFSGGTAIMALDAMQGTDLTSGELPPSVRDQIVKHAPPWLGVGNPVDYWPMVMGSESLYQAVDNIWRYCWPTAPTGDAYSYRSSRTCTGAALPGS